MSATSKAYVAERLCLGPPLLAADTCRVLTQTDTMNTMSESAADSSPIADKLRAPRFSPRNLWYHLAHGYTLAENASCRYERVLVSKTRKA